MKNKKVAIFTASGSGMGADAAKNLASKGYTCCNSFFFRKRVKKLANKLNGIGLTGSNQSI